MGKQICDAMYNNKSAMAGGTENGVEPWRAHFVKHKGGADQVELGGIASLQSFPHRNKVENLQHRVGKCIEVKDTYGAGVSDLNLRSM